MNQHKTSEQDSSFLESDEQPGMLWYGIHWALFVGQWVAILLLFLITVYLIWVNYAGYRDKKQVLKKVNESNLPTDIQKYLDRLKPDDPGKNGAKYYHAAFPLASEANGPLDALPLIGSAVNKIPNHGKSLPEDLRDPLSKFVNQNQLLFGLLEKARKYDYHNYNLRDQYMADQWSYLNGVRGSAHSLATRALYYEMKEKPNKSANTLEHILHLANSFQHDRFLVDALEFRISTYSIANYQIEYLVSRNSLNRHSLRELRQALRETMRNINFETYMKLELAQNVRLLKDIDQHMSNREYFRSMKKWFSRIPDSEPDSFNEETSWYTSIKGKLWLHFALATGYDESKLARLVEEQIRVVREFKNKKATQVLNKLRNYKGPTNSMGGLYRSELAGVAKSWLVRHVSGLLSRLALAVELFRLEHGHWPADRGGLSQEWFSDPYGDGPMKYRKLENGVVVYSVGPDGNDDGGLHKYFGEHRTFAHKDITFRLFDPEVRGKGPELDPSASDSSGDTSDSKK